MKFKVKNPNPFPVKRSDYQIPETLTVKSLPSGKLDAYELLVPKPKPQRPASMICDCCMNRADRMWMRRHYGFCMGFPNAGRSRHDLQAGMWSFCVYCWALFEAGELDILVARVATLNPDLSSEWMAVAYHLLAQVVYGEVVTWESGQPYPRIERVEHDL